MKVLPHVDLTLREQARLLGFAQKDCRCFIRLLWNPSALPSDIPRIFSPEGRLSGQQLFFAETLPPTLL